MGKWQYKTIDSICKMIADGDWIESKDQSTSGIRLLQTGNVGNGVYFDKAERAKYISSETFSRLNCTEVLEGDILISRLPDPVGRACIVPNLKGRAITAVDCTILRIDKSICNVVYIRHVLKSPEYFYSLNNFIVGSTRNRISRKNLQKVCIPIPPLEIQNEISKLLDNAEKIVRLKENQIEKLDLLIKSQFNQMFGDLKTNPYKWSIVPLSDTVIIDTVMTTDFMKYQNFQHVGIENIEKDTGKIINTEPVRILDLKSGKYLFSPNHIIYSKIRPNLNKVALPDFEGLCSADAYPILPKNEHANKYYITYVLRSEFFLGYILRQSDRTNIPKANKKQLLDFSLPLPPVELQNQFADFVQQVEQQKILLQQSLTKMEASYKSLMQKCFRGEIFS